MGKWLLIISLPSFEILINAWYLALKINVYNIRIIFAGTIISLAVFLRTRNFDCFIRKVSLIPDSMAEPHFSGQYGLVYDKKGTCLVDFVGKIENINEEYDPIRERFGLPPLEKVNKAASLMGKNWMDYYTPFTAWLVYRKYRKDFIAFGYEEEYMKLRTYLKNKK